MYCAKCGKQIPDDAKFCTKCGHKVAVIAAPGEGGAYRQPEQPARRDTNTDRYTGPSGEGGRGGYSYPDGRAYTPHPFFSATESSQSVSRPWVKWVLAAAAVLAAILFGTSHFYYWPLAVVAAAVLALICALGNSYDEYGFLGPIAAYAVRYLLITFRNIMYGGLVIRMNLYSLVWLAVVGCLVFYLILINSRRETRNTLRFVIVGIMAFLELYNLYYLFRNLQYRYPPATRYYLADMLFFGVYIVVLLIGESGIEKYDRRGSAAPAGGYGYAQGQGSGAGYAQDRGSQTGYAQDRGSQTGYAQDQHSGAGYTQDQGGLAGYTQYRDSQTGSGFSQGNASQSSSVSRRGGDTLNQKYMEEAARQQAAYQAAQTAAAQSRPETPQPSAAPMQQGIAQQQDAAQQQSSASQAQRVMQPQGDVRTQQTDIRPQQSSVREQSGQQTDRLIGSYPCNARGDEVTFYEQHMDFRGQTVFYRDIESITEEAVTTRTRASLVYTTHFKGNFGIRLKNGTKTHFTVGGTSVYGMGNTNNAREMWKPISGQYRNIVAKYVAEGLIKEIRAGSTVSTGGLRISRDGFWFKKILKDEQFCSAADFGSCNYNGQHSVIMDRYGERLITVDRGVPNGLCLPYILNELYKS